MNGHRRSSGTYQQQGGGSPNGAHPQLLSVNGLADGDDEVEDEEAASPLHRKHPAVQVRFCVAPNSHVLLCLLPTAHICHCP
eukprot:scaffold114997_cov24-Tisochrysis_lutea.AAC.1